MILLAMVGYLFAKIRIFFGLSVLGGYLNSRKRISKRFGADSFALESGVLKALKHSPCLWKARACPTE
ncbi:hypothetical protein B5F34_13045 [Mediterranea sp. An20]|nr:hypothetical protein B5F34_13045 [Mediterranea sp. An20]